MLSTGPSRRGAPSERGSARRGRAGSGRRGGDRDGESIACGACSLPEQPARAGPGGIAGGALARDGAGPGASQGPGDLLDLEELEDVTLPDVVEVLQLDAALEAFLDLAHVVLHALQGLDFAGVDDHVVAQQAEARVAPDQPRGDHAAGDGADLARDEDGADLA